jgi:hypothetical protein
VLFRSRLAVDIGSLHLPTSREKILSMLVAKGFKILDVDVVALARGCVNVSKYRRGARLAEAPLVFDCSSFIKWLYGQCGIWLPRRSIQQRELGESVELSEVVSGDVVFVSGHIDYYLDDPTDGVGHVGIATGNNTVVHAANKKIGIVETSLDAFVGKDKFRGARRYGSKHREIVILETPIGREVEIADDVRWIVLQSIGK